MHEPSHIALCESCDWRARLQTRDDAVEAAMMHRARNPGHLVAALWPPQRSEPDAVNLWLARIATALEHADASGMESPTAALRLKSLDEILADLVNGIPDPTERSAVARAVGSAREETYGAEAARIRALIARRTEGSRG